MDGCALLVTDIASITALNERKIEIKSLKHQKTELKNV